jgi:hypothetical protein
MASGAILKRMQKPKDQTQRQHALEELEQLRHELEQLEYQHQTAPFMSDDPGQWDDGMDDPDQDYDGPFHSPLSPHL